LTTGSKHGFRQSNDERHDGANPQALANRGIDVFQSAQLVRPRRFTASDSVYFFRDPRHDVGVRHDLLQGTGQGY
jgi:hypothetical protein